MFKFGKTSKQKLSTCHEDLQRVINRAMSYQLMDFSVIDGKRTAEEQYAIYKTGNSFADGYEKLSRHQSGEAVDVVPYPVDWYNTKDFYKLASIIFMAAMEENVQLEWGGFWKTFKDMPHFELKRR